MTLTHLSFNNQRTSIWISINSSYALISYKIDPGIKAVSFMFPALASKFFTTNATWDIKSQLVSKRLKFLNIFSGHRNTNIE